MGLLCSWEVAYGRSTVEPPIKDTPNKDTIGKKFSIKDTLQGPKSIILVHFNLQREDNLSIQDKMSVPNMFITQIVSTVHIICFY